MRIGPKERPRQIREMAKRKHQRTRGSKKQEGRGRYKERPTERKIREERED